MTAESGDPAVAVAVEGRNRRKRRIDGVAAIARSARSAAVVAVTAIRRMKKKEAAGEIELADTALPAGAVAAATVASAAGVTTVTRIATVRRGDTGAIGIGIVTAAVAAAALKRKIAAVKTTAMAGGSEAGVSSLTWNPKLEPKGTVPIDPLPVAVWRRRPAAAGEVLARCLLHPHPVAWGTVRAAVTAVLPSPRRRVWRIESF